MKEDRISQLPDPLICQILYHLSTKQSIKTSVLSTRWRNLWLWVPSLDLNSRNFPDFDAIVSFGDRFFDSSRIACLDKLKLTIDEDENGVVDNGSYLTAWMDAAIKRKIQHLDFRWSGNLQFHTSHLRLHKCETLVYLKLFEVTFDDAEVVSFPCLKTMHLEAVLYPNEATFEKLVSRCPVLEELEVFINEDDDKGFQVHSQSLKRLFLVRESTFNFESVPGVVIDAPLLDCLSIDDIRTESVIVTNLESNAKLDISLLFGLGDFDESRRSNIRSFLSGISRVGDMTICADTFNRVVQYSKIEPLPQFGYMSCLDANIYSSDLKWLPTFLESCPILKSLTLVWQAGYEVSRSEEMSEMSFSFVPKCLVSSLESIDIEVPITGCAAGMKIISYFLENSAILKKFSLGLAKDSWTEKYIHAYLPRIPRASTNCEVYFFDL